MAASEAGKTPADSKSGPDLPARTANGAPPTVGDRFQICQKCGATFMWERTEPEKKDLSPLILRLSKPSADCDCGYGNVRMPDPA